jgi:hypothetical protein
LPVLAGLVWLSEALGVEVSTLITGSLVAAEVGGAVATGTNAPSVIPASTVATGVRTIEEIIGENIAHASFSKVKQAYDSLGRPIHHIV